tara:strand:- start:677 stop:1441 length:765 start_codon:yes stop_codon:yes gene_type:complete
MQLIKIDTSTKHLIYRSISFLLILALIKISSWWCINSNNLILKNISISKTKIIENEEFYKLVDKFMGNSLEEIRIDSITKIIEDHPYVEAARVSKWYPSTIKIELIEREPIAVLNINPMVLLDKYGFVLPYKTSKMNFNLPILNNFNTNLDFYPFGNKVLSENVGNCIEWLNRIKNDYPSLYKDISEMKMTSKNDINIILAEYPTQIFLGNNQIWTKIEILKEFETELLPMKLSDFSYLDMRYDNQVIAKNRTL